MGVRVRLARQTNCGGDDGVMRNGRAVDLENPGRFTCGRARRFDWDQTSGSHQGQRSRAARTGRTHDLHPTASRTPDFLLQRGRRPHMNLLGLREICGDASCTVMLSSAELATGVLLKLLRLHRFFIRHLPSKQGVAGSSPAGIASDIRRVCFFKNNRGRKRGRIEQTFALI